MRPPVSKLRWSLIAGLIAIALVGIGLAAWTHFRTAHGHGHGHHGAAVLSLHDGQRWETDEPLRLGMQRIRDAVASSLADPADRNFNQEQAKLLADAVQENVAYLMQNCQLEPAADSNLHVLITELMTGAALVAANPSSDEGVMKLADALAEYPEYFEHQNWRPLPKPKP